MNLCEIFADRYARGIEFLLENGREVVQYRLHKEILHDLTPTEEENMLERVMQTPDYQLLLTHVKPNGYIGIGMHSWEKFKSSYLDDGENAARLLANYGIPRETPIVRNFVAALRDDEVLEDEFSYYHPEKVRFANRSLGINSGSTLDVLIYSMQALLGYGDDPEVTPFVKASYRAFTSLLDIHAMDDLTAFNPNLKRKYNYPVITPDTIWKRWRQRKAGAPRHPWRGWSRRSTITTASSSPATRLRSRWAASRSVPRGRTCNRFCRCPSRGKRRISAKR